jgi:hypothetical protein
MSDSVSTMPTPEEVVEMIAELEKYRERLIADMTDAAKKAKLTKAAMEAHIAPELEQIDLRLNALRQLQA